MSLGGVVRALARSQKPAASHDAVVSEQVYAEDLTPEQLEDPRPRDSSTPWRGCASPTFPAATPSRSTTTTIRTVASRTAWTPTPGPAPTRGAPPGTRGPRPNPPTTTGERLAR